MRAHHKGGLFIWAGPEFVYCSTKLNIMKSKTLLFAILFIAVTVTAHAQDGDVINNNTIIKEGVGLGTVIAVVASWSRNQSILWAILHGIFSWLYVIFFALTRDNAQKL